MDNRQRGDPACDLVIAWTMFGGASRQAFGSGWTRTPAVNRRIIADIVAEHEVVSGHRANYESARAR